MVIKQFRALLLHKAAARHGLPVADCCPGEPHRSCVTGPSPDERGSGHLGHALPGGGELDHVDAFALKVIEAADDGEVGRHCLLQGGRG